MAITIPPTQVRIGRENFLKKLSDKWNFKIGRIYDLLASPCQNANVFIFVGALIVNIPEAIFSVSTHDCSDNSWDKGKQLWRGAQPRGGRRHGMGGTPGIKGDGQASGSNKVPSRDGYWVIQAGNFLEKIGAGMLIIDAALDLAINWMSTDYEWNGCPQGPDIHGMCTVAYRVYGDDGVEYGSDLIGMPNPVGVLFGIGGFITTAPAGALRVFGTLNTGQFLTMKYVFASGVIQLARTDGHELVYNHYNRGEGPLQNGGGQSVAEAEANLIAPTGIFGEVRILSPSGGDPSAAGQIEDSPFTVGGSRKGMLFAGENPNPCSNFPITGTAPRGR